MNRKRLEWIINSPDGNILTKWEKGFVQSCENYLDKEGMLTIGQEEMLEKLFREKSK